MGDSWFDKNEKCSNIDKDKELSTIIRGIAVEFDVVMGNPGRVKTYCSRLLKLLENPPSSTDLEHLDKLVPLLPKKMGAIVNPLFDLFYDISKNIKNPWPFLQGLLSARDANLVLKALNLAASLAQSGALKVEPQVLGFFADKIESDGSPLNNPEGLAVTAKIVHCFSEHGAMDIFLHQKDIKLRRLAARILDLPGVPVPEDVVSEALGDDAFGFFMPYLLFSRASYSDLLQIIPTPGKPAPALNKMRSVESSFGKQILKEIVSRMGWQGINFGIEGNRLIGLKIGDSFPLIISAE